MSTRERVVEAATPLTPSRGGLRSAIFRNSRNFAIFRDFPQYHNFPQFLIFRRFLQFLQCRNFPQFPQLPQPPAIFLQMFFARPPRVHLGALCVPCAEVLLEALGGLVRAPHFSRTFPAISCNFPPNFSGKGGGRLGSGASNSIAKNCETIGEYCGVLPTAPGSRMALLYPPGPPLLRCRVAGRRSWN